MKKDQVQVGKVYAAKVSGAVVPVRITAEKWQGDRHVGWVGTNVRTGKTVRIKTAQRLRNEVGPTPPTPPGDGRAEAPAPEAAADAPAPESTPAAEAAQAPTSATGANKGGGAGPAPKAEGKPAGAPKAHPAKPDAPKRLSAIDAAAKVLAEAGRPMKAREMIQAMEAQGLWRSPGGRTPAATLYAAIIREIAARKKQARFRKTARGTFEAAEHASAGAEAGAGKGE